MENKYGEIKIIDDEIGYYIDNNLKYFIKKENNNYFVKSKRGKKWWKDMFKSIDDAKNAIDLKLKQVYSSWETKRKNNSQIVWNKGLTKETSDVLARSGKKGGETKRKKYDSGELKIWNKGLTKETNKTLKKLSEDRKGSGNPMHRDSDFWKDEEKVKQYKKKLSKALSKSSEWKIGKNIFEIYGNERGLSILNKMKKAQQNRPFEPHKGHRHSDENIKKFRENTSKMHAEGRYPQTDTKPMREFYEILKELKVNSFISKEYCVGFYSIDYVIKNIKIAFEVDGDFWHCNPKKHPDGAKYACQKKNLRIQKSKTTYLTNLGWKIYRFWESDILNKRDVVKEELKEIFKENNLL